MGAPNSVDRSLVKNMSISEKDVTLGLELDHLDDYIESIFPENFNSVFKTEIKKKLDIIKWSGQKTTGSNNVILDRVHNIMSDEFYSFMFSYRKNKADKTIDIAYQIITGKIDVAKAYKYKKFLGIRYGTEYETISPSEKLFLKEAYNIVDENYLSNYLNEEKKKYLANNN